MTVSQRANIPLTHAERERRQFQVHRLKLAFFTLKSPGIYNLSVPCPDEVEDPGPALG